ncbi:MAG: TonB-dependent receptor, partial [Bacteroidota bacterium]
MKGQVVDREGEVLPFATVVLMHAADSSMAKAGYTDEMGQFGFEEVEEGAYLLNVRYTSMAPAFAAAFEVKANAAFTVPNIVMAPTAATLEGLTITAQKSLISIKPDMMVFNVSASTTAIGTNALELLRKAPGVSVDQRDRIMLQGKAGVRIYIDGKPTPLTDAELAAMLRAMPAQQIDNIELITNPSARFEAEGNAGIINIVLQKSARKGGHATVALGYNVQENARYEGALSGNYRSEKVNIYGAFNQNNGTQANFMELHRRQNGHVYDQRVDVLETTSTSNGRLGMDVDLSEKSTFGVMANGFLKNVQQDQHALTEIREMGSTQLAGLLDAWSQNEIQHFNGNVNANYRFEDKEKGSEWNVDANYGFFDLNTETYQPNVMYDFRSENPLSQQIFTTFAPTQIDIAAIKVDHTRNFLGGQLGFGGKISRVRTTNDFQLYDRIENEDQLNTELSNRFDYSENVNALYTTWQGESGKWNFQAGLRAEQTNSLGQLTSTQASGHDTVARSYVDLFPSAGLTYQLDGRQTLRLNYSRRIDRPRYQNLNPFLNRLDALTFKQGNPFLQPQYTHSLEVAHVLLGSVSTSLRYSRTTDLMTELADTIAGGGYLTHVNLD